MSYLTKRQVDQLLWPIRPERVSQREGLSHVEAYDIRAHLNRVFGFGMWDGEVVAMDLLFEQPGERTDKKTGDKWPVVSVGYRAHYRLTVRTPDGDDLAVYTEWASGDAVNFPINKRADAHDFAMKTAESQALKRAATNLGDQFGLSLYNKGSVAPLVGGTHHYPFEVAKPADEQDKTDTDVSSHITTQLAPEVDPPDERESARITQQPRNGNAPADEEPPPEEPGDAFPNDDLRARILDAVNARDLLAIRTEAVRAGVHKELTANRDGISVTIGALIDAEITAKSRRKES